MLVQLQLGLPMHELGHAIGLFHEQSRPDRDDTVTINWNNIYPSYYPQFEEANLTEAQTYGVPYDVGSLMHYGSTVSILSCNL
jgi:astacin